MKDGYQFSPKFLFVHFSLEGWAAVMLSQISVYNTPKNLAVDTWGLEQGEENWRALPPDGKPARRLYAKCRVQSFWLTCSRHSTFFQRIMSTVNDNVVKIHVPIMHIAPIIPSFQICMMSQLTCQLVDTQKGNHPAVQWSIFSCKEFATPSSGSNCRIPSIFWSIQDWGYAV